MIKGIYRPWENKNRGEGNDKINRQLGNFAPEIDSFDFLGGG